MGRIGLVHLEAITKAPGVVPVIVSNPTVSKAEVCSVKTQILTKAYPHIIMTMIPILRVGCC